MLFPQIPDVHRVVFQVQSEDGFCIPSTTQSCRFLVGVFRASIGEFDALGTEIDGATIRNAVPFRVVLGGSNGLGVPIPPTVAFTMLTRGPGYFARFYPVENKLFFGMSPDGNGAIALGGQFESVIEGKQVTILASFVSDSPLVNRMPQADAGSDQVVTTGSCAAMAQLDASASSDPDNNLRSLRWFQGEVYLGFGPALTTPLRTAGENTFSVLATDEYGGASRDDVIVNAQFPPGCFP